MYREKKYSLPELYYQAQNGGKTYLRFKRIEQWCVVLFLTILISFSIVPATYEMILRLTDGYSFDKPYDETQMEDIRVLLRSKILSWVVGTCVLLIAFCCYDKLAKKYHYQEYKEHRCNIQLYYTLIITFECCCFGFESAMLYCVEEGKDGEIKLTRYHHALNSFLLCCQLKYVFGPVVIILFKKN